MTANEALEKVASYGLGPNMIFYLMSGYNVGIPKGTSILFLWSAATNFTPALGAFLADSYLGRFFTIALGTISTFLVPFPFSTSSSFFVIMIMIMTLISEWGCVEREMTSPFHFISFFFFLFGDDLVKL